MKLAVLTTGRQDWGILRSTCALVARDPRFELCLLAGGMHLSRAFGSTAQALEADGFRIREKLAWIADDGATPAAEQAGKALSEVAGALERQRPDALMLVGDRFETLSAAHAATLTRVPVVHLHGGEETAGAIDNAIRHAITKLAHLHLVSHPDHAARVRSLGEDPATVHVVGAPGLDNALRSDLPDRAQLESQLGVRLTAPIVLVTLHPTTLGSRPADELAALVEAMDAVEATYVITLPNSDPGNDVLRAGLRTAAARGTRFIAEALGDQRYWGLLTVADAMLGNSSSALIEAPVRRVPAVNLGDRQKGRLRSDNVIDAPPSGPAVTAALRRALSPAFRAGLASTGPFGDGRSAPRIVDVLSRWTVPVPPIKPSLPISKGTES